MSERFVSAEEAAADKANAEAVRRANEESLENFTHRSKILENYQAAVKLHPENRSIVTVESLLKMAGVIIDSTLKKYTPNEWEKDQYQKPSTKSDLFKINAQSTVTLVKGSAEILNDSLDSEKFYKLARWLAANEQDSGLKEMIDEIEDGKNAEDALKRIAAAYEYSRYTRTDKDGEEVYSGDPYTRRQVLYAVKAATGKLEKAEAVREIAEACFTHGSQGSWIRTGATRKMLELALGESEQAK